MKKVYAIIMGCCIALNLSGMQKTRFTALPIEEQLAEQELALDEYDRELERMRSAGMNVEKEWQMQQRRRKSFENYARSLRRSAQSERLQRTPQDIGYPDLPL
jgi:hypothetical protein